MGNCIVRMAEDGWNSRDPHRVSLVYTEDAAGGTALNSRSVERKSWRFSQENGLRSWTIGY